MANLGGRPTLYTEELAAEICRAIATSTEGIRKITKKHSHFPCTDTIFQWRFDYPTFSAQYTLAKQLQADLLAEEIIDISDDGTNDFMEDKNNEGYKFNGEAVARSRLRVDSRKWIACKLLPKVYGEKQDTTVVLNVHENNLSNLK
jgi:hypothetical protein